MILATTRVAVVSAIFEGTEVTDSMTTTAVDVGRTSALFAASFVLSLSAVLQLPSIFRDVPSLL